MAGRYSGADIAAMIFAGLALLGCFLPWGDASGGPFDQSQAFFALFLAATALLVFGVVPNKAGRKWTGVALGLLLVLPCWMAIDDINSSDTIAQPFSFIDEGKSMQAGLWITLLSSIGLAISSLVVRTRPRDWGPEPDLAPTGAPGIPYGPGAAGGAQEPAAPPIHPEAAAAGWTPVATPRPVRRLKCPRCATQVHQYGSESPTCPNCGFRSASP